MPRLNQLRILLLDGSDTAALLGSSLRLRSVLGVLQALGNADVDLVGGGGQRGWLSARGVEVRGDDADAVSHSVQQSHHVAQRTAGR